MEVIYDERTQKDEDKGPNNKPRPKQSEKEEILFLLKKHTLALTSLCCFLDGYVLLFLTYNSSIFKKQWQWTQSQVFSLNIVYHLMSGLGSLFSIITAKNGIKIGLHYSLALNTITMLFTLPILNSHSFMVYFVSFFFVFLTNGHLLNICTNMLVEEFSHIFRAPFFSFAFFFGQFGKFILACIIFKFYKYINHGRLMITLAPIIVCLMLKLIITCLLINLLHRKNISIIFSRTFMTENGQRYIARSYGRSNRDEHESNDEIQYLTYHHEDESRQAPELNNTQVSSADESVIVINNLAGLLEVVRCLKGKVNLLSIPKILLCEILRNLHYLFVAPVRLLLNKSRRLHTRNLMFMNFSLAIQFFSMISVFPIMSETNMSVNIIDMIFVSKLIHTVLLFFFPVIFLIKCISRKDLLLMAYLINLLICFSLMFDISHSENIAHLFRFVWNICFITVNLYTVESANKEIRGVITSVSTFVFQIGCLVEIFIADFLVTRNVFIPLIMNLLMLIVDILLISKFMIDTHFMTLEEIDSLNE